jgi:hypothetical protein
MGEAPERRGALPITAKETTKDNIVRMVASFLDLSRIYRRSETIVEE